MERKLNGTEPLQLPTDFARPAVQSKKGANANFNIDKKLTESLLKFSRQNDVTLFMTLLSAYNVMLYRYSGQEDFTVGSPVAGRQQAETEDMIGFFINTVALRSEIDGELPFRDFYRKSDQLLLKHTNIRMFHLKNSRCSCKTKRHEPKSIVSGFVYASE
ncbi:MAG: condensation domain-containing protein [Ignavibacteria bacterium]